MGIDISGRARSEEREQDARNNHGISESSYSSNEQPPRMQLSTSHQPFEEILRTLRACQRRG